MQFRELSHLDSVVPALSFDNLARADCLFGLNADDSSNKCHEKEREVAHWGMGPPTPERVPQVIQCGFWARHGNVRPEDYRSLGTGSAKNS